MSALDLLWHVLGFMAPAAFVALCVAALGRWLAGPRARPGFWLGAALNFAVSLAALVGGLLLAGSDGRMASYAALVLASATTEWLLRLRRG